MYIEGRLFRLASAVLYAGRKSELPCAAWRLLPLLSSHWFTLPLVRCIVLVSAASYQASTCVAAGVQSSGGVVRTEATADQAAPYALVA